MQIAHTLMLGIIVIGLLSIADAEADSIKTQLEVSPRRSEWVKVTTSNERIVNAFIVYQDLPRLKPRPLGRGSSLALVN